MNNSKFAVFLRLMMIFAALCLSVTAQKISKPKLVSVAPTESQRVLIDRGIRLHDQGKFDEAIAMYQKVLDESPDCATAMYEMALSYGSKGDSAKAIEIATKGSQYKSPELALFYVLIGNTFDDLGKPQDAIQLYKDAIKFLKDESDSGRALSSAYYNLGVTYTRQKMYKEAREALKNAVESNPRYASPNYLLAEVFFGTKYKVPALLAAGRLISLEFNTARSKRSAQIFVEVIKPAKKDETSGNINVFLDMNAPKDEGDFAVYDLVLATLLTVKSDEDKNKTDEELFADAFDTLIGMLTEDKKLQGTFIGKTYLPFFAEAKKKGNSRILAYLIMQLNGNPNALKWLVENEAKTIAFIDWAKSY